MGIKRKSGLVLVLLLVVIFLWAQLNGNSSSKSGQVLSRSWNQGNFKRSYLIYVPKGISAKTSLPVVIILHGGGGPIGSAQLVLTKSGWREKAEKEKFLAVFPDGLLDDPERPMDLGDGPKGNYQTWDDGSGWAKALHGGASDVDFISAILDKLGAQFNVDKNRIFVTGFSNGGSMSFRLGVELSDKIAAIAPVAGALYLPDPKLAEPVSLLRIVGNQDKLPQAINTQKSDATGPATYQISSKLRGLKMDSLPPDPNPVVTWTKLLSCSPGFKVMFDNANSRETSYSGCRGGASVLDFSVKGLGHVYPGISSIFGSDFDSRAHISATDLAWDFFKANPKKKN